MLVDYQEKSCRLNYRERVYTEEKGYKDRVDWIKIITLYYFFLII